jgi:hypothetical protein
VCNKEQGVAMDGLRKQVSKSTFEIEESNRRTAAFVNSFEDRLEASLATHKEDLVHKISAVDAKLLNHADAIKKLMDSNAADTMSTVRKHNAALHEELNLFESTTTKTIDVKLTSFSDESKEQQQALKAKLTSKLDVWEQKHTENAQNVISLEEELLAQFTQYNETFNNLNNNQMALERAQQETKMWTEKKVNDLFSSTRELLAVHQQQRDERDFILARQFLQQQQQQQQQQGGAASLGGNTGDGPPPSEEELAAVFANVFSKQRTYISIRPINYCVSFPVSFCLCVANL